MSVWRGVALAGSSGDERRLINVPRAACRPATFPALASLPVHALCARLCMPGSGAGGCSRVGANADVVVAGGLPVRGASVPACAAACHGTAHLRL
eukprot:scaffold34455_cov118-Isochrysis_galbana.AAC.2